jgi:hypothetical protein
MIPLIHVNSRLDLLNHMGQDPDAVLDRPVHTGFKLLRCICFHLLELCCFKSVLADHQRTIHPFLEEEKISILACLHKGINAIYTSCFM